MLSAVSNVSSPKVNFRADGNGVDFGRQGAYSTELPADTVEIQGKNEEGTEKKSSGLGKKLLIAAGVAVAVAAALVGLKEGKVTKILEEGKTDAGIMEKLSDKLAKMAEFIEAPFSKGVKLEKELRIAKQDEAKAESALNAAKEKLKDAKPEELEGINKEIADLQKEFDAKTKARGKAEDALKEFKNPKAEEPKPETPATEGEGAKPAEEPKTETSATEGEGTKPAEEPKAETPAAEGEGTKPAEEQKPENK